MATVAMADLVLEKLRVERRKKQQDYDGSTPRCGTCVYYRQESHSKRKLARRKGHAPTFYCTFGNFPTTYVGLCNEWHSRDGEKLAGAVGA